MDMRNRAWSSGRTTHYFRQNRMRWRGRWVCQIFGVTDLVVLVASGGQAAVEGDVERVERGLPPVGAENPCHLAGCSAGRWSLGSASGTCESGLGLPGRGMIFGLWD
jgi:hypothetical protein